MSNRKIRMTGDEAAQSVVSICHIPCAWSMFGVKAVGPVDRREGVVAAGEVVGLDLGDHRGGVAVRGLMERRRCGVAGVESGCEEHQQHDDGDTGGVHAGDDVCPPGGVRTIGTVRSRVGVTRGLAKASRDA